MLANTDLIGSRIRNYKRMFERRVVFGFGVAYETGPQQLAAIPAMLRAVISREEPVRFERTHLSALGASAIEFEAVYFVLDPDFNRYMDIQQRVILGTMAALREAGVGFAYPTRTVHLVSPPRGSA